MRKKTIIIKGRNFISDFKALCSSPEEVFNSFKKAGLSNSVFYNWTFRTNSEGEVSVSEDVFNKLCDISGLDRSDYFISEKRGYATKPKTRKVNSTRLKNGITVTTYTKAENSDVSATTDSTKTAFALNISNFRDHMEVYRKLLGISTSDIVDNYHIDNYVNIANGREVLSISTYFALSAIFISAYKALPDSPIKVAFYDLASKYNDIFVQAIYFGDNIKKKGSR